MCGRYNLRTPTQQLVEFFDLALAPELEPRYNIAPTQPVAAIRRTARGRELSLVRWGLIPSWADDPKIGDRMINARADSVATKPAFRSAFKRRRCLIPADGFYEWKKSGGKTNQPYQIGLQDGRPFAFAGLWEHWAREGDEIESCTILTTDANELVAGLHDRMPVILDETAYDRWLDPELDDRDELESLLLPFPARRMKAWPVSTVVNNPRNETPECLDPLS
ncbi:MAG TPA: SOS response-associated peptidase [Planctomycetaceae bacterium]|nr:SOS response-associated peptidase [Planctomycetaceae bacterium]